MSNLFNATEQFVGELSESLVKLMRAAASNPPLNADPPKRITHGELDIQVGYLKDRRVFVVTCCIAEESFKEADP